MKRPIKDAYYRLKSGHGTLCFRVLKLNHISSRGYYKIKIDWFNECSGSYWGNQFGLPRNWKLTFDNYKNFERFQPKWDRHYG